jgi:hypothetical protein
MDKEGFKEGFEEEPGSGRLEPFDNPHARFARVRV